MDLSKLNHLYPDFLVVGAAKSGTSSLDQYFRQHPDIFMPKVTKELNFFHLKGNEDRRAILKRIPYLPTNILSYLGFFYHKKPNQISGECSPSYLYYYDDTIKNIKALHPNWQDLKIIIILREPIDKIWSHYRFVKMKNLDPDKLNLHDSLKYEEERFNDKKLLPDLFYLHNTSYYHQVKAYMETFKHVKIIKYEELKETPESLIKDVFSFLEVDNKIKVDFTKKHNTSKPILNYKNDFYEKFANGLPYNSSKFIPAKVKKAMKEEEKMPLLIKKYLAEYFINDIKNLQKITDKNFENWLLKYKNLLND